MAMTGNRSGARRGWKRLAALFGALALGSAAVSAQEAPAHWMAYAAAVGGGGSCSSACSRSRTRRRSACWNGCRHIRTHRRRYR